MSYSSQEQQPFLRGCIYLQSQREERRGHRTQVYVRSCDPQVKASSVVRWHHKKSFF